MALVLLDLGWIKLRLNEALKQNSQKVWKIYLIQAIT
jgi:hypothetical protein